jgi:hypothetical protein
MSENRWLNRQTNPLIPIHTYAATTSTTERGRMSLLPTHIRIVPSTPPPHLAIKDAVPARNRELVQQAAGAALRDGVSDCTQRAACCAVVDACVRRESGA